MSKIKCFLCYDTGYECHMIIIPPYKGTTYIRGCITKTIKIPCVCKQIK